MNVHLVDLGGNSSAAAGVPDLRFARAVQSQKIQQVWESPTVRLSLSPILKSD